MWLLLFVVGFDGFAPTKAKSSSMKITKMDVGLLFATTATPQNVGESERDGRTLIETTCYLPRDGGFTRLC